MSSRKKAFNFKAFQELFVKAFTSGLATASDRFYRLAGKPDLDKIVIGERTALHHAAARGNLDLVEFCLERGADPNIMTAKRITPLLSACENSHFDVARALIKSGANVNHGNMHGRTPLMFLTQSFPNQSHQGKTKVLEFVRELVRSGADMHKQSFVSVRPVHFARNHRDKRLYNYISDSLELHLDQFIAKNNSGSTDREMTSDAKKWDRAKVLTHAVVEGKLDTLVKRMKALKIGFVISDFSEPISKKYSAIDAILGTDQIDCLLDAALWQGHSKDLFRFISLVPEDHGARDKLMDLYNEVQRLNVSRSQARNKRPKLG